MPNISRAAAIVIALLFAAILVAYVVAGWRGKSSAWQNDPALRARCSSTGTSDAMKRALFRRAAELRGRDQEASDQVSSFAAVRIQQAKLSGYDESTDAIHCQGTAVIELPGGGAVGDPHSFAGAVDYIVRHSADGTGEVVSINNAQRIVAQLAMVVQTGSAPTETQPATETNAAAPTPVQTRELSPQTAAPPTRARQEQPSAEAPPALRASEHHPKARAAPTRAAPPRLNLRSTELPRTSVVAAETRRSSGPSFDCRRASKAAHFAICQDAYLASLDRQAASDFNRAFSNGTPAVRELLQRTLPRFLGYRNSCRSNQCIANAYRSRITEINDIAAGRWRVP
jgi:hypothetical protein